MPVTRKTSQLQIRVSPEQKATLKRLAAEAGLNVSQYVLATVLPSTQAEFAKLCNDLRAPRTRRVSIERLRLFLAELSHDDFRAAVSYLDLEAFPAVLQNYVAAAVEDEARSRAVGLPTWVRAVTPLDRPHFAWDARSLWPHLMRITPVAYKRRNVFVDAAGVESGPE